MHCLRLQAETLKYVDSLSEDSNINYRYASVFTSQLSDPELHLLLYYGLSHYEGDKQLKHILRKYNVLRGICLKSDSSIWHRIPEILYYHSPTEIKYFRRHIPEPEANRVDHT